MIVGRLEDWNTQVSGPVWAQVFEFLTSLAPDADEGITNLDGDALYANVMRYETRTREEAVLETHRKYIDVQMTLIGAEGIDWYPRAMLEVDKPYDAEKDVVFYKNPGNAPAHVDNRPGAFTILFPEDAHMPQLIVGDQPETVKKVVIKISTDLVR